MKIAGPVQEERKRRQHSASGSPVVASASGSPVVASASGSPVVASGSGSPVVASGSGSPVVASGSGSPVVAEPQPEPVDMTLRQFNPEEPVEPKPRSVGATYEDIVASLIESERVELIRLLFVGLPVSARHEVRVLLAETDMAAAA
jgi:hypothetical protein